MKVFLITPDGEQGPLTAAQAEQLYRAGEVNLAQLCRVEGTEGSRPLGDVFQHLANAQEGGVATARKQIRPYNPKAGDAAMKMGTGMLIAGVLLTIFYNPLSLGFALLIAGTVMILHEQTRLRKAAMELAKLQDCGEKMPGPSPKAQAIGDEHPVDPKPAAFDY